VRLTAVLQDMGLATESADKYHVPLTLGKVAQEMYRLAMQTNPSLSRKDFSSVYQYLESRADHSIT
jgi:3-hydroxyisobutyrate dehydrogenase